MIKASGILIIIISGILSGLAIYNRYILKIKFLTQYINLIIVIKNEIRYSQKSLSEILKNFICENPIDEYIKKCITNLEKNSFKNSWNNSFYLCKNLGISNEEYEIINNFGNNLGTCDTTGQIQYCDYTLEIIKPYLAKAEETKKSKGKLYIILCIGASLLVSLLVI